MVIGKKCFNSYETLVNVQMFAPLHIFQSCQVSWIEIQADFGSLTTESICFENLNRTKEK